MQTTLLETIKSLISAHEEKSGVDKELTISVAGHSLGAGLCVLSAFDIVESNVNVFGDGTRVPVVAYGFAQPRVGNPAFVRRFAE
jgi:predicted lipase